tara:strand:- start:6367 stop:6486 length:120 start_codon:yes stop_codon:yes gene_type:complete
MEKVDMSGVESKLTEIESTMKQMLAELSSLSALLSRTLE